MSLNQELALQFESLLRENIAKEREIQELTDCILKIRINLALLTEKKNEQIRNLNQELKQAYARIQRLERKVRKLMGPEEISNYDFLFEDSPNKPNGNCNTHNKGTQGSCKDDTKVDLANSFVDINTTSHSSSISSLTFSKSIIQDHLALPENEDEDGISNEKKDKEEKKTVLIKGEKQELLERKKKENREELKIPKTDKEKEPEFFEEWETLSNSISSIMASPIEERRSSLIFELESSETSKEELESVLEVKSTELDKLSRTLQEFSPMEVDSSLQKEKKT